MRKTYGWLLLTSVLWLAGACKSQYEKIRTSGNGDLILKSAFEYYDKKEYQKAVTMFDLVLNNIKVSEQGERAYFYYAFSHYNLKQYTLSSYYFKNFANTYLNSPFREEAAFMSAYSNYELSPSYRLDQGSTRQAIEEFQLFSNLFPASKRVEECNKLIDEMRRKLEEKAFGEGELYFNMRQYQSAVISFDNLLRDYPESPDAERVRFLIAKSEFLLSKNSVVDKRTDRYILTVTRCNDFLEKYSDSKYSKEIKQILHDSQKEIRGVRKTT